MHRSSIAGIIDADFGIGIHSSVNASPSFFGAEINFMKSL
ncbi:hypothetical protein ADICYQ_4483 [Cyclobacterium qasimii M12-11B]|uniref:Uncharacterized protein n=1 Tax=Cyclobacterium qasimii M12-11B TaxID=641524 RepID=S7WHY3_9BACT|nr:hypothetical protein ADICYQ_4483 [Cyclobacterium qasimii M12-11B]